MNAQICDQLLAGTGHADAITLTSAEKSSVEPTETSSDQRQLMPNTHAAISQSFCKQSARDDVTRVVAVHPDLRRVPQTAIAPPEGKQHGGREECPRLELPIVLPVDSGCCASEQALDQTESGPAGGRPTYRNAACGVSVGAKHIPPHLRDSVKAMGAGPGKMNSG
jgi:hypothetical protein